jgi:hypothetical protein
MRKIAAVISLLILLAAFSGCNKDVKMHQSKIKNEQGLPKLVHQIDKDARGRAVIDITEDLKYPDMIQYQDAVYDFISGDPPPVVADWFMANLDGAMMKKNQAQQDEDSKWIIHYKKYIIDIVYYSGSGSLIRYKYDIKN